MNQKRGHFFRKIDFSIISSPNIHIISTTPFDKNLEIRENHKFPYIIGIILNGVQWNQWDELENDIGRRFVGFHGNNISETNSRKNKDKWLLKR